MTGIGKGARVEIDFVARRNTQFRMSCGASGRQELDFPVVLAIASWSI